MKTQKQMPSLLVYPIDHKNHRYPTVGDWIPFLDGKDCIRLDVRVSKMNNADYEFMVAVHELIEAYLCLREGITDAEVSDFDIKFEQDREVGKHSSTAEPGNHPKAPYRRQHKFATKIEKLICRQLGISWETYDKAVVNMP